MSFPLIQSAEDSICFYKNICKTDADQVEALEELAQIRKAAADGEVEANHVGPLRWADFGTEHARKALGIGTVLVLLNTCSGVMFVVYYSTMAFYRAGLGDFPIGISELSMLSMYSTFFVAKLAAMQTVDHIGRKVNEKHGSKIFEFKTSYVSI